MKYKLHLQAKHLITKMPYKQTQMCNVNKALINKGKVML